MSPLILYLLFEKHGRYILQNSEAAARNRSFRKAILKKTPVPECLLIKLQASDLQLFLKKALAQVYFCKFCEISMKTFSYRTLPVVASENFSVVDKFWF